MYSNQSTIMDAIWLNLEKEPREKTKAFARTLFEADIADKVIWFDKRDNSITRQNDPEMTLDSYLANVTESVMVRFVIGREEYIQGKRIPAIALLLRDCFKDNPTISRFAWFFCPLNDQNYTTIDKIFQEVYGISMNKGEKL